MAANVSSGVQGQSDPPSSGKSLACPTRQRVQNWSHSEVMALILCKQKELAAQKDIVDPRGRMIPVAQKWQKISEELQRITTSKVPRNPKMCKDKWNGLHGDYKKISDYHRGTGHYSGFWDLSLEEKDKLQLPRQFHSDYYEAIKAFQGERPFQSNTVHIIDSQVDSLALPVENSQNIVNLTDTPAVTPAMSVLAIGVPGPNNTLVKRKRKSSFQHVIEATDKSSKVLVEAMDRLNTTQVDLENAHVKLQRKSTKAHLDYLKLRDKKSLKMGKNMVTVLSNLSQAMCHTFIKDPDLIPAPLNMSQSSSDGAPPPVHCLDTSEEEAL